MAAILNVEEEDQFDELELALEKASGSYQEELKRSSAPVIPRSMPFNFAGAIMNVRELLILSVSLHRHDIASNAMTRIQTISCFSVRELGTSCSFSACNTF